MTKFDKAKFNLSGGYLTYGTERKFVARFKYRHMSAADFRSFLIKNFSVEEYFARREADEAPLTILTSKGYVLPHIRKQLKERGYEVSPAGVDKMITDAIAARNATGAA